MILQSFYSLQAVELHHLYDHYAHESKKIDNEIVRNAYEAFQWIVNNANYDTIQELITSKALNKESVENFLFI